MNGAVDGLSVDKIHVWRGDRHVLRGTSFRLSRGSTLHVTGPNGAGKTTLLRVASGLLRPEGGSVSWDGRPIGDVRFDYQKQLAYGSHEPALKGDLTALENLRFAVGLRWRTSRSELEDHLAQTGVGHCAELPARVLSAGQRRRVSLARMLALRATLWLLDEPFTNLDADGTVLLRDMLLQHVRQGGAALVVAHHDLGPFMAAERLELRG